VFKSLRTKLILAFILVSGLSIVAVSFQNYKVAKDSLTKASFERLTGLREAKSNRIEDYFKTVSTQIKTLAEDPLVLAAMRELAAGFNSFEKDSETTVEQRAEYKQILRNSYETDFMQRLQKKESNLAATPAIALTAHALKGDAEKNIEAGCDGHTTKPIRKKILLKTIFDYTKEDKSCLRKKA